MTLFNGGNFVCEGNPDQRKWDGCQFMAQNERLVYWPMLRSGDDDLLHVALDFYRDRTEMSRLHAKKFWGVDGVAWSEPFSIFGMDSIGTNADGRSSPDHLHYHYTSGMEFALMMLELGRYTGQDIAAYLPAPEGIIAYYDQFYRKRNKEKTGQELDPAGHLVIYPSDACEPFHGCKNNTDVIAGLTALCDGILALPPKYLTPAERTYYGEFKKRIPPFPIKETGGHRCFAPAESWEWVFYNGNMDFPNMYVCFPFNIVALGRPGIEEAEATWDYGAIRPAIQRQNQCWYQSAINLARLGRTAEAAQLPLSGNSSKIPDLPDSLPSGPYPLRRRRRRVLPAPRHGPRRRSHDRLAGDAHANRRQTHPARPGLAGRMGLQFQTPCALSNHGYRARGSWPGNRR